MKRIFKYGPFKSNEPIKIENVKEFVLFAEQDGQRFIWCEISDSYPGQTKEYIIVGTGWDYDNHLVPVQSLVDKAGYVWHLLTPYDPLDAFF